VWPGLNADVPGTQWTWERYWLIVWHTIIGYSQPTPVPAVTYRVRVGTNVWWLRRRAWRSH